MAENFCESCCVRFIFFIIPHIIDFLISLQLLLIVVKHSLNIKILSLALFFQTFSCNFSIEFDSHQIHDLGALDNENISLWRNDYIHIRVGEKWDINKIILLDILGCDDLFFSFFDFFWRRIIQSDEIFANSDELVVVFVCWNFGHSLGELKHSRILLILWISIFLINSVIGYSWRARFMSCKSY